MPNIRNWLVFAILLAFSFWSFWIQYNVVIKQKKDIEILSSKLQQMEYIVDREMDEGVRETPEDTTGFKIKLNNEINDITPDSTTASIIALQEIDPKIILIWTPMTKDDLFRFLLRANGEFVNRKCKVKNCFLTTDRKYFDITKIVVLFDGRRLSGHRYPKLPDKHPDHIYVFASVESSYYYPICTHILDDFFDLTWTYKLNSDIYYGYIVVRNILGEVIGPKNEMHWLRIDEMKPIDEELKNKFDTKTKLAAWLVSNCYAPNGRYRFVAKLQAELKKLETKMTVDIFGECGTTICRRDNMNYCLKKVERDYYFYLSFENSFAEDYVTEKLLHPLQHYTVPIVYGTANYTKFMPDGIYLNALELGPRRLAARMLELVSNREQYYRYFSWINHYSFHNVNEEPDTDVYCKLCAAVNDDEFMKRPGKIQRLKEWWNPPTVRYDACTGSRS